MRTLATSPASIRSRRRTSALMGSRYDADRVSANSDVLQVLAPTDARTRSEPKRAVRASVARADLVGELGRKRDEVPAALAGIQPDHRGQLVRGHRREVSI
jgi:hypothetical protein